MDITEKVITYTYNSRGAELITPSYKVAIDRNEWEAGPVKIYINNKEIRQINYYIDLSIEEILNTSDKNEENT